MGGNREGGRRLRVGRAQRETLETQVSAVLALDDERRPVVDTGLGFFDHMLTALAVHAGFGLELEAHGDLQVDAHHTVEDVGMVLGEALRQAVAAGPSVERFGDALVPMDEALSQVAADLSGRAYLAWEGTWPPFPAGGLWPDVWPEFFRGLGRGAGLTLHVRLLAAANHHHAAEATFKALGRALRAATRARIATGRVGEDGSVIPSTKGRVDGWT